jgi:hypothetical protein
MSGAELVAGQGGLDLREVADTLRHLGYDIEPAQPTDPPGTSLVARHDRGERAVLMAIDASGRFRVEWTWLVGEWPSESAIGAAPVRVVDSVTRAVNASGQVTTTAEALSLIAGLAAHAPWAGPS